MKEKKVSGDLNFIITNDETLRDINIRFLEHDYNTDVISFGDSKEGIVNGEIYISLETVRNNAINYNVSLRNELFRVIIHGVLHLMEYDDKTLKQKKVMRRMENRWLSLMKE
jgi:probable rRNA maturation factor